MAAIVWDIALALVIVVAAVVVVALLVYLLVGLVRLIGQTVRGEHDVRKSTPIMRGRGDRS